MKVYADNAATTRISDTAFDAMAPYFKELYGNPSSLYTLGQLSQEALCSARETVAKCLNCDMKEITFTSGGSEADNQAILTGAYLGAAKGKKHIISSAFEHHAVLHTLEKLEKQGFEVTLLPVHSDGFVRVDELENAIREDTALVTIMFANNEIGTVQPIREIGEVCHKKSVLFHTDAVQAAGHIKIDVTEQNSDMLSLSAHKFHGPKGAGVLYAKKGIKLYTLIEGGAQERGKEMDAVLDLWINTVYNDSQVQGSDVSPLVYIRNGTGKPLLSCDDLARRWGISKATASRYLNKLKKEDYIMTVSFAGSHGSAIYIKRYLSTMFQISDMLVDKDELAMALNIELKIPEERAETEEQTENIRVSNYLNSVSKTAICAVIEKVGKILSLQGFPCYLCPKTEYMLLPLSECKETSILPVKYTDKGKLRFLLAMNCSGKEIFRFDISMQRSEENAE